MRCLGWLSGLGVQNQPLLRYAAAFHEGETQMWNSDELEGKGKQIKGTIKEKLGDLTDNDSLEREGVVDQAEGQAQEEFGKARRKVKEAVEQARENVAGK